MEQGGNLGYSMDMDYEYLRKPRCMELADSSKTTCHGHSVGPILCLMHLSRYQTSREVPLEVAETVI